MEKWLKPLKTMNANICDHKQVFEIVAFANNTVIRIEPFGVSESPIKGEKKNHKVCDTWYIDPIKKEP